MHPPPKLGSSLPSEISVWAVVDELEAREDALLISGSMLTIRDTRAPQRVIHGANKRSRDVQFEIGQKSISQAPTISSIFLVSIRECKFGYQM